MTKNAVIVMAPGNVPARRNSIGTPKLIAAGRTLMDHALRNEVVQHFVVAAECRGVLDDLHWLHRIRPGALACYVDDAKEYYRWALSRTGRMVAAVDFLGELPDPDVPITLQ